MNTNLMTQKEGWKEKKRKEREEEKRGEEIKTGTSFSFHSQWCRCQFRRRTLVVAIVHEDFDHLPHHLPQPTSDKVHTLIISGLITNLLFSVRNTTPSPCVPPLSHYDYYSLLSHHTTSISGPLSTITDARLC